mmetsp:Transcript_1740/g.2667  ORF Transcript_1740/g.2667 Transcript_1740/m.2667 type:complete len:114 (+) Transcript_1740:177-518(+)
MATPLLVGLGIAAAAYAGRFVVTAIKNYKPRGGILPKGTKSFPGGFESKMNRKEAALILGVRENSSKEQIREAHKKIMLANHPDRGGSPFLASKVNEAKDVLLGLGRGSGFSS